MISVLVDTNILVDVFHGGEASAWSKNILVQIRRTETLAVNQVIWSEISAGFSNESKLDDARVGVAIEAIDDLL